MSLSKDIAYPAQEFVKNTEWVRQDAVNRRK